MNEEYIPLRLPGRPSEQDQSHYPKVLISFALSETILQTSFAKLGILLYPGVLFHLPLEFNLAK